MSMGTRVVLIAVAAVLGSAALIWRGGGGAERPESSPTAVIGLFENRSAQPGKTAPDFRLYDLAMKPRRLSDFRGTPVVMNFFASWCAPCKAELPLLRAAQDQAKDRGFVVLGVSNNDQRDAVQGFAQKEQLTYPILIDGDNVVGVAYQVAGPPYTYFIDRHGVITAVVAGELDQETLNVNMKALFD